MVSPPLNVPREVERVAEGQCGIAALANRRKIENGLEGLLHLREFTLLSMDGAAYLHWCVVFHFTATRKFSRSQRSVSDQQKVHSSADP
jgi:hypothetical protein